MKNKPKSTSRPKKKTKSVLKKTPAVKAALLDTKKKPAEKTGKNKIGTLDNANLQKMEKELRGTKERLRLLSEAAEEGIAVHYKGVIIDANDALARIFGYELSEMIGMKAEKFATPESWKVIREHIAKKYDKPYEGVGVRKDGSTFICSLVGKPYKYKGRTLRLSVFRDITDRRQTEEKLSIEQQRFRIIAEQSSDIILLLNREGVIIYENPAVERILGFKIKERIGKNAFENILPDDKNRAKKAFDTFISDKEIPPRHNEVRVHDINGNLRTFESVSRHPIKDYISEDIIVNLRDITDRKKAEEAMRRSEEEYRSLFEQSLDGIIIIYQSRIVMANHAFCVISGLPLEKAIGANPLDFIHPEDRKMAEQRISAIKSGEQFSETYVYRAFRADGSLSWIDLRSKLFQWKRKPPFQTIVRDVTELKKAEESSNKAASEWQSTFDTVGDAICLLDVDQRILRCNIAMSGMLGVKQENLIGRYCWEVVHGTTKPIPECPASRTKSSLVREEMELQLKDRWFNVIADPILNESGSLRGIIHIVRDITERKKAESQREATLEVLRDNENRLRALYNGNPIPTFTWQKQGDEFILSDVNDSAKTFTKGQGETFLGRQASEMYKNRQEILRNLQSCFDEQRIIRMESISEHFMPGKFVVITFVFVPPDLVMVHMEDISERKQAEKDLQESEELFRNLFQYHSAVKLIINPDTGSIMDANRAAVKYYGWPYEQFTRMNIRDINMLPPEEIKAAMEKAKRNKMNSFEFRHRRADGSIRDVEVFSSNIRAQGKDLLHSIVHDITERKKAEESLREAELKFRTIFDSASDGILLFNLGEEKFSAANEKICNMLGYTNEELLNLSINDIHPQETIPFVTDQLEKLLKKEVFIVRDLPVIRKDKTVFLADITGSPITLGEKEFAIGIFRDITERKQAEEAAKVNHAQMLAIFDAIDEPVYVADTETYEMLYINRATNLAWGDTQNRKCHEYLQHRDTPCPFCTNTKILGKYFGRSYVWEFQNKINQRWYRCIDKAIPWPNGRIVRYEMAIDITERKKAEDDLEKYRKHLEELVQERTIKLEAANKELESFSYSASHDLRAPLRTIEGFSKALLEDCEDKLDLHGRDYLKRIITATRHMALLIEDMLKLSRITRTEMNIDKINLTQMARSIINELKESQPQRHVEIKIADGLEDDADPRLMRILLENLLDNAWKFTGKQANALIELGLTKEGEKKVYFIRDNGAGFDMMYVDKLFAPFQRLHSFDEYPGTGIGLATVRRIINRHGGKAWTKGQVGKGATFYFTLKEH